MKLSRAAMTLAAGLPVALFAVLAIGLGLGLGKDPTELPSVLIGKPAPSFDLAPVREGDVGFSDQDIAGKVALINIYASWCSACRIEHPMLMELAAQGAPIYGVDWKDAPQDGAETLRVHGDPYIRVGSDEAGRLALDLGVSGAPETFVVDKAGRIRHKQIGPITPEIWRGEIAPLIARLEAEP